MQQNATLNDMQNRPATHKQKNPLSIDDLMSETSDKFVFLLSTLICIRETYPSLCTAYCIWSDISSFSNLNRWSSSPGLFCHVPLKRDQGEWDWRLRLNDSPNAIGCTREPSIDWWLDEREKWQVSVLSCSRLICMRDMELITTLYKLMTLWVRRVTRLCSCSRLICIRETYTSSCTNEPCTDWWLDDLMTWWERQVTS